jgi:hypothetical protein
MGLLRAEAEQDMGLLGAESEQDMSEQDMSD